VKAWGRTQAFFRVLPKNSSEFGVEYGEN